MKRDRRLRGLSDDHHQALVLGRSVLRGLAGNDTRWIQGRLERSLVEDLLPHFEVEELLLVPALEEVGLRDMSARLKRDHDNLRASAAEATRGDMMAARMFAQLLIEHVRFEERVVFPEAERMLDDEVLNGVAVHAPWPTPPG